jgi:hypothetical protein
MRKDMARVIVERPRVIDSFSRKGRARPLEELPFQESMRRGHQHRGGLKLLNENLAPLRRYLERQVGRPWDKVYSEIAEGLHVTNTIQQHVRDHLVDFVAINPRRGVSTRFGLRYTLWYQPLYVDPDDGLLKRTDRLPEEKVRCRRAADKKRQKVSIERIKLSDDRDLRLINGIWYEITLAPLPRAQYRAVTEVRKVRLRPYNRKSKAVEMEVTERRLVSPPVFDLASGVKIPVGPDVDNAKAWHEYRRVYPEALYAVSKRQLSSRELRQHGVTNQPPKRSKP